MYAHLPKFYKVYDLHILCYVEQTGIELTEILFPSHSLLWVKCLHQHAKLYKYFKWIWLLMLCKATKQYVNNKKKSFEPDVPELQSQHCNVLLTRYWEIYILSMRILVGKCCLWLHELWLSRRKENRMKRCYKHQFIKLS